MSAIGAKRFRKNITELACEAQPLRPSHCGPAILGSPVQRSSAELTALLLTNPLLCLTQESDMPKGSNLFQGSDMSSLEDPFDLNRFIRAQESVYDRVIAELDSGQKRSHWMWYVFPQVDGLGHSSTAKHYAMKSLEEARHYLDHPILGTRLDECTQAVIAVEGRSVSQIFGYPDDLKLKSCMTLFAAVASSDKSFVKVLDKYFHGERDSRTLQLLKNLAS